MDNKFPGKDISIEDIKTKFPLVAKKNKYHISRFKISGVEFGSKTVPIFAGPNMVESKRLILDVAKNVKSIGANFLRVEPSNLSLFLTEIKSIPKPERKGLNGWG